MPLPFQGPYHQVNTFYQHLYQESGMVGYAWGLGPGAAAAQASGRAQPFLPPLKLGFAKAL